MLVYWGWGKTVECKINTKYYANLFSEVLTEQVEEFQLLKHLGTRKIEITLEKVPEKFSYTYNNSVVVIYLNYYFNATYEKIRTDNQYFTLSYRLLNGYEELKKDTLTYRFNNKIRNNNLSTSSFIENYVMNFQEDFKQKSTEFIQQIIDEL